MSAAKHTPGPWKNDCNVEITAGLRPICGMKFPFQEPEQAANASLIAAAPDMLSVLQELDESCAYWSEYDVPVGIVSRIQAAIAKATGGAA